MNEMDRYKVEEIVKIKQNVACKMLAGKLGIITAQRDYHIRWERHESGSGFCSSPGYYYTLLVPGYNGEVCCLESELEPPTDCYDKISWDDMKEIWSPDKILEAA